MAIHTQSSGPPTDIPASELWNILCQIPRPYEIVDVPRNFPGTDKPVGQVAIWVLTQEEQMICATNADRFSKKILKEAPKTGEENRGYDDIYNNAAVVEILCRCCRDATDVTKPAFPSPAEVRSKLSVDEVAVLFRNYLQIQATKGPIISYMDTDTLDAWIRRLAEAGNTLPLGCLSSAAHEDLTLAQRLHKSLTDMSSAGSAPSDSPNAVDPPIHDEFAASE